MFSRLWKRIWKKKDPVVEGRSMYDIMTEFELRKVIAAFRENMKVDIIKHMKEADTLREDNIVGCQHLTPDGELTHASVLRIIDGVVYQQTVHELTGTSIIISLEEDLTDASGVAVEVEMVSEEFPNMIPSLGHVALNHHIYMAGWISSWVEEYRKGIAKKDDAVKQRPNGNIVAFPGIGAISHPANE